jgi:hypothetical protein
MRTALKPRNFIWSSMSVMLRDDEKTQRRLAMLVPLLEALGRIGASPSTLHRRTVMKIQRLLIVLTVVNIAMLTFSLSRTDAAGAQAVAPILRGRALEIVDDGGRVRASITVLPRAQMPDGTMGYPETVLLRLISSAGRPNVKIAAKESGAALSLGGESDPTHVLILAEGGSTSMQFSNQDGRKQIVKP